MTPYAPSGRALEGGRAQTVLIAAGGGLALGLATGWLGAWIRVALVLPLAAGVGVGLVAARVIRRRHVRAPRAATAAALLGALAATGADLGVTIAHERAVMHATFADLARSARERGVDVPEENVDRAVAPALVLASRHGPLPGSLSYVLLTRAPLQVGESLIPLPPDYGLLDVAVAVLTMRGRAGTRVLQSSEASPLEFGAGASLALWLIEVGVATAMALIVARGAARAPYCEACARWVPDAEETTLLGPLEREAEALEALRADDGARLAALAAAADPKARPAVALKVQRCARRCDAPVHARLVRVGAGEGERLLLKGLVPARVIPPRRG